MTEQAPSESDAEPSSPHDGVLESVVPKISKTPFFQAMNSERYQRQALIREIEADTGNHLICYVAGIAAPVDREDVLCFVDLLHNIPSGDNVDLLLHTAGGDIDAAEKLITMVRKRVGTGQLRVVVPDFAKSAGTMMALGADSIVMSDSSELGAIDPQIIRGDANGNRALHSVKHYLDAYEEHTETLRKNPNDVAAQVMLSKLSPDTVRLFQATVDRARKFAEDQLRQGMMKNGGLFTKAVSTLLDNKEFQTHGQPISWEDAQDPKIGLTVEYLKPNDELWLKLWQLYCLQVLSIKDKQKLFESQIASICINSRAI